MFFQRDPSSPEQDRRAASVAVVPFAPLELEPETARTATGFLEDVIAELARSPDIEVLAAHTSLSLSPDQLDPRSLMEAYGVTHVLDCAVRPGPTGSDSTVKRTPIRVRSRTCLRNQNEFGFVSRWRA